MVHSETIVKKFMEDCEERANKYKTEKLINTNVPRQPFDVRGQAGIERGINRDDPGFGLASGAEEVCKGGTR